MDNGDTPSSKVSFPNESPEYRRARSKLLQKELALRAQLEAISAERRALPLGGQINQDYEFRQVNDDLPVRFSELFAPEKNTLILCNFVFAPDAAQPSSLSAAFAENLEGNIPYLEEQLNIFLVTKAPAAKMRAWLETRAWRHTTVLSSCYNYYNRDYHAETPDGFQLPMLNVFHKSDQGIYHTYGTEMLFSPEFDGGDSRHLDLLWPLWNALDLTPEGRGAFWYPKHN